MTATPDGRRVSEGDLSRSLETIQSKRAMVRNTTFQSDMQARCQRSLDMKNDRRVNSWGELQQELYRIDKNSYGRYRTDFVYRGVADKSWSLQTSLQRIGRHYGGVEGPMLRNFLKYAGPNEINSNALLFQLAVAQHHGLPTRVLDWTTSPKVAAHFATWEEKDFDKDGAIWCVDVIQARALLPEPLLKKLEEERAIVFSIEMLA